MDILRKVLDKAVGTITGPENLQVKAWVAELDSASEREEKWRKYARGLVRMYEGVKSEEIPFNILYSNTETLAPALYNNQPRPVVQRRYKDDDPLGKIAADVCRRTTEFLLDNELDSYTPFDKCMTQDVLEALVPGRGSTWFKYDARFQEAPSEQLPESAAETDEEPAREGDGVPPSAPPEVSYEMVCQEHVPWDRLRMGYAKVWADMPWISRDHYFSRQELVDNFGEELGNKIPLTISGKESADISDEKAERDPLPDSTGADLALVVEIWDKATRKVYFLCPDFKQDFLRVAEDPLGLTGFFPCAEPLCLFQKIGSMVPTPLYKLYEEQSKELNRITVRINKIISMMKVRGMYDSTVEGIDRVLQAEDGVLIPAENVAALLSQGNALEKALWLMPVEKLVQVVQQLYLAREAAKQVIYEINGIADVMRGASKASETLGAQELKSGWGTLRLKRMQKVVANYVRDCLRIQAEIAMSKLDTKTIAGMTGLNFPTAEEKMLAQEQMMKAQQDAAMTDQPPVGPLPQLMKTLELPSWDDVMGLLRDDLQRNYRIDIETNSTVDAEATEDKEDMSELLNAIAQFFNGVAPLVQEGIMPFEAAKTMLLAVVRRFKFGPEVEDQLKALKEPQKPPGGEDAKAQVEIAVAQMDMEMKREEIAAKKQEMAMEAEFKRQEHQMKVQELRQKSAASAMAHQQKMQQMAMQASMPKATAASKPAKEPV